MNISHSTKVWKSTEVLISVNRSVNFPAGRRIVSIPDDSAEYAFAIPPYALLGFEIAVTRGGIMAKDGSSERENDDRHGGQHPARKRGEITLAIKALQDSYEGSRQDQANHDRKTLFWGRVAGIGVAVYTGMTAVIVGAAIYSAMQAQDSAVAAREANNVGQGPFVTFTGLRIDQQTLGKPGLPYVWFTALVQNSGNTPTKDMKYVVESGRAEPGDPEQLYQHPTAIAFSQRITLPPHFNGPLALPISGIPQSAFKTMVDEHGWYFVYGTAHYRDRFTNSKEHVSKFCFAVGANISDASQPAYTPCRFWNCTDDDCELDKADYEAAQVAITQRRQP